MTGAATRSKQTYRSVVSHLTDRSPEQEPSIPEVAPPTSAVPTAEQRERAQHEAWLAGLSDPERRAYEAYKQRGLAANERELRDVLRAAMSLHPNRETAAEVIRDLRAPLGQADAARGPDVQPEQELPTFSKLGIDSDLANESAYQQAYGRLESLQRAVLETRRRDEATYKALGLPELPKDSPRRKLLGQAVAPVRGIALTAQGWAAMGRVDERVYRIRANIIDDPLWIAADYLDRTTSLEKLEHRVLACAFG